MNVKRIILLTSPAILSCYFLVSMEWLFFVTKPSFLSPVSWGEKLLVLSLSPLVGIFFGALFLLVFSLPLAVFFGKKRIVTLVTIFSAVVLTSSIFLLIDNFTYSVFHLGVISTAGSWRFLYGGLFIVLFFGIYRTMAKNDGEERSLKVQHRVALSFFVLSLGILCVSNFRGGSIALNETSHPKNSPHDLLPNIMLISSDGLNASNLSLYGYERKTTEYLQKLGEESLVFENAFTNCANTGCSLASILTGKLPTETKLLYPPDILRGSAAYEHLPGILRRQGYYNVDISMRHYADPYDLGMRDAFDEANNRQIRETKFSFFKRFGLVEYFLSQIYHRLEDRLFHAYGIRNMINEYDQVVQANYIHQLDPERIELVLKNITRLPRPFFIHLHLIGTHGPKYLPTTQMFSGGREQTKEWMRDFYDDAILDFDHYLEQMVSLLIKEDLLEDTLLIVHTDHGKGFKTDERLPLLVRFPKKTYQGRITRNVQNLDIAPTILDYLGIEKPHWMEGESLLKNGEGKQRPIISVASNSAFHRRGNRGFEKFPSLSPIQSIGSIGSVVCDQIFQLDFRKKRFVTKHIKGHTASCPKKEIPSGEEMRGFLLGHLTAKGFDPALFAGVP